MEGDYMKKKFLILPAIITALLLSGCDFLDLPTSDTSISSSGSESETTSLPSSEESSVSSSESEPVSDHALAIRITGPETCFVKERVQFVANPYPSNTTINSVKWSSSDTSVIYVNSTSGKTNYAKKAGTTIITATGKNELGETVTGTFNFRVLIPDPTSVEVTRKEITLAFGKSTFVPVKVLPETANQTCAFSSSNTDVATVDGDGKVTAKSVAGTTTITAVTCNGLTDTATVTVQEVAMDKYTLMVYMCGSNLESDANGGLASMDIEEMRSVANQPDDINIIIETGGATKWHKNVIGGNGVRQITYKDSNNHWVLGRYHLDSNNLYEDDLVEYSSMGASETLQSFLQWGFDNFPADKYSLILWNHGGALDGCCFDDIKSGDSLTADEVDDAVTKAKRASGIADNLEFITYDACLMSVLEIAEMNSHNFNYMLSSQEVEGGLGYNYDAWLPDLYSNPDIYTPTLLKKIGDTFLDEEKSLGVGDQTQSAYDLTKMASFKTTYEAFATALAGKVTSSNSWSTFASTANGALRFGYDDSYGYVYDIYDMAGVLNRMLSAGTTYSSISTQINNLLNAIGELVVYNNFDKTSYISKKPCGINMFIPTSGWSVKSTYTAQSNFSKWQAFILQYGNWYY